MCHCFGEAVPIVRERCTENAFPICRRVLTIAELSSRSVASWIVMESHEPALNNHLSPFAKGTCISVGPGRSPCMRGDHYDNGEPHFLTVSGYRRLPLLSNDQARQWFVDSLDDAWCGRPWMNREHDPPACHSSGNASPNTWYRCLQSIQKPPKQWHIPLTSQRQAMLPGTCNVNRF
jgi:hypothetical protein